MQLLVIGDSGLGKTTLVRCLLAVPGEPITLHDGSSTDFRTFDRDPDVYLSTVEWDDEEDHIHWTYQARCLLHHFAAANMLLQHWRLLRPWLWHAAPGSASAAQRASSMVYVLCVCADIWHPCTHLQVAHELLPVAQVQDTPGYGDDLDLHTNISRVLRYIKAQNARWHRLERAPQRGDALKDAADPRVDLCLFCLPPHRLRNIDVQFMHEVSKVCWRCLVVGDVWQFGSAQL